MMTIPYSPIVVNTGSKLVVIDTGTGEANFERSKGAAGQFHSNLKAAGIDPQCGRHRDHLALPRRPHQRPAHAGQQARVPECRNPGAGRGVEILHGRRRDEPSRPRDRMKGVFAGARDVFDALGRKVTQYEAGKEVAPGITVGRDATATRRATSRTSSRRATARCSCRPTSPTCRAVRAQSGLAPDVRSGRRRWRRRRAARSTTCWRPRR